MGFSYPKRVLLLNLESLEYRRIFHDLMLCYQILHRSCDRLTTLLGKKLHLFIFAITLSNRIIF